MKNMAAIVALSILVALLAGIAIRTSQADLVGLGLHRVLKYETLSGKSTSTTQVAIVYTKGDISDILIRREIVSVGWDGDAVVVAALKYHKMGIRDDRGRLVLTYVDAVAGGVGKKTAQPRVSYGPCILSHNTINLNNVINKRDLSLLSCKYITTVTVTDKYVGLRRLMHEYSKTIEFYVEASSAVEAETKVGLDLGFVAAGLSVKSTVKIGNLYKVTIVLRYLKGPVYISYAGTIVKETKMFMPDGSVITIAMVKKNFDVVASINTIMPPSG